MKPTLDPDSMDDLEKMWKMVHSTPEGPQKQKLMDAAYRVQARVAEKFDLPVQAIAPDAHMLGVLDWGSGMARTAVGEPLLAAKAGYDKLTKGKTNWTPSGAADRIASAVIPVGEPAQSSGQYLEQLGVPEGGHLAETSLGKRLGIERGSRWDITGRGAAGFGLDMGMTPKNLLKAPEMAKRLEGGVAAVQDTGRLSEFGAGWGDAIPAPLKSYEQPLPPVGGQPQTAQRLRTVDELRGEAARAAGAPGMLQTAKEALPRNALELMVDPTKKFANMLQEWRFRHADEAARLKNKPLPSQIMREHGGSGVTSSGIRSDMQQALTEHEQEIQKLGEAAPFTRKIPRGSPDDYDYLLNPGLASEVKMDESMMYPLYDAEQKAAERAIVSGADAQGARKFIEDRARQAEALNPGFSSAEQTWEDATQAAGTRAKADLGQGELPLFEGKPVERYQVGPQVEIGGVERPFKTITTIEGDAAMHGLPPKELDPLSLPRDVGWDEIRKARQQAQSEAAQRDWYRRRSDELQPVYPGEAKKIEAEAALYNKWAQHLGGLETDLLDEARPGLGGQVYLRQKDMAGLLEGGAWLDRAPKTGPTSRSQIAFNPWQGRALVGAEKLANNAAMAGYQVMRNPYTRYLAAPAARSLWLENYWQRQNEETPQNPWALTYKYGAQQ